MYLRVCPQYWLALSYHNPKSCGFPHQNCIVHRTASGYTRCCLGPLAARQHQQLCGTKSTSAPSDLRPTAHCMAATGTNLHHRAEGGCERLIGLLPLYQTVCGCRPAEWCLNADSQTLHGYRTMQRPLEIQHSLLNVWVRSVPVLYFQQQDKKSGIEIDCDKPPSWMCVCVCQYVNVVVRVCVCVCTYKGRGIGEEERQDKTWDASWPRYRGHVATPVAASKNCVPGNRECLWKGEPHQEGKR